MKSALTCGLAALVAMTALTSFAQTKKKVQVEPASSPKTAAAPDPLSSFQRVVRSFNAFFASGPRRLVVQEYQGGRSVSYIIEFAGQDISYDVEKTSSLVSPYSAVINMKLAGRSNTSCGDI